MSTFFKQIRADGRARVFVLALALMAVLIAKQCTVDSYRRLAVSQQRLITALQENVRQHEALEAVQRTNHVVCLRLMAGISAVEGLRAFQEQAEHPELRVNWPMVWQRIATNYNALAHDVPLEETP